MQPDWHIAADVVCHPRGSGSHQSRAIDWELDLPRVPCGAGYVGIRVQVGWLDTIVCWEYQVKSRLRGGNDLRASRQRVCTRPEHLLLGLVSGEMDSPVQLGAGVIDAAQLSEQVGTDSRKQVIRVERGLLHQVSESIEPSLGAAGLSDCDGAIQLDHRRRC